jgi:hypothetical protein
VGREPAPRRATAAPPLACRAGFTQPPSYAERRNMKRCVRASFGKTEHSAAELRRGVCSVIVEAATVIGQRSPMERRHLRSRRRVAGAKTTTRLCHFSSATVVGANRNSRSKGGRSGHVDAVAVIPGLGSWV